MSNKIPQHTLVKGCTLPPWDNYKLKKFADKSTNSRLSSIKACVNGGSTANGTYKGSGMGGSSAGFSQVQPSGSRTNKLASIVNNFTKSEQDKFAAKNEAEIKNKKKDNKKKANEKKIIAKKMLAAKKNAAAMLASKKQNKQNKQK